MANNLLTIINAYKEMLESCLKEDKYQLMKAPKTGKHGIDNPTLVIPKVATGCLPHQNFNLYEADEMFFQAPYILVGWDEASINNDDGTISLLIQVCCYSSSCYGANNNEIMDLNIPDNKAFEDVILLLEWMQKKVLEQKIVGVSVESPIRMGSYDSKERVYPYSFGYISFDIKRLTETKKYDYWR